MKTHLFAVKTPNRKRGVTLGSLTLVGGGGELGNRERSLTTDETDPVREEVGNIMCRHGSDGTLHRGKREKGHLPGSSRARAVVKRHMGESPGCASLDAKEFAQTFTHFNGSHLHMAADLWNWPLLRACVVRAAQLGCVCSVCRTFNLYLRKLAAFAVRCSPTEYGSWMRNMCGNPQRSWKTSIWETALWSCFLKVVL